ncbi:MAG TPA: type II toxin-antitoxin system YafQ family toxin [Candidatus Rifleibacterium sp.]|nr:type II toxin-antitoxin system YafQ family toxin [Candidatus Rifleibacterium sp.]HPT47036.1 type II toxin-antitoxin system YafQ family toxin [Candidatus Rifleibacterium sp.]
MLKPIFTSKFKRDYRRLNSQGKELKKLEEVMIALQNQQPLAARYRDHQLYLNWAGRRECHIEPDWLLVYKVEENTVVFERTGSHSDVFN